MNLYNSMMSVLGFADDSFRLAALTAAHAGFRRAGFPRMLPMSLAVSVTHHCNARCSICAVSRESTDEMAAWEFGKVFESLRGALIWATITGGEPFLRDDLGQIAGLLVRHTGARAVALATNGAFPDRAAAFAKNITSSFPRVRFIMNISLDAVGPDHDLLRGLDGSFEHAMRTLRELKSVGAPNMDVGFHTAVSKHNADLIPGLIEFVAGTDADHHRFEPAQGRVELGVSSDEVAASADQLEKVHSLISAGDKRNGHDPLRSMVGVFRRAYYRNAFSGASGGPICHAGFASAHVSPQGDVWPCCVLGRTFGNLRDCGHSFPRTWFSDDAAAFRSELRKNGCACTLANAAYTNMLLDPASILKAATPFG